MPMIQIPTEISGGSWIRLAATGESSASRPNATDAAVDLADRPMTKASSDTSNRSGSSCPERCATNRGDHHREREREQRQAGHAGPQKKRCDRERAEHEIRAGRRVRDACDDGGPDRERWDQHAHLFGLRPLRTSIAGTLLDGTPARRFATPPADGDATSYHGPRPRGEARRRARSGSADGACASESVRLVAAAPLSRWVTSQAAHTTGRRRPSRFRGSNHLGTRHSVQALRDPHPLGPATP